jgi:hypothetical protein
VQADIATGHGNAPVCNPIPQEFQVCCPRDTAETKATASLVIGSGCRFGARANAWNEILLLAGTTFGLTGAAFAADMPVKAPLIPQAIYNWTGFYVGVNAGMAAA